MADTFPKTAAGIQHVQIGFNRARQSKLHMFTAEFRLEYNSAVLPPEVILTA
jgi:hypothetical protein